MFFGEGTNNEKIMAVRRMILADDLAGRQAALKALLPMQRKDFEGIFEAMAGKPVTIRTLDPPLHEFLPHDDKAIAELAKSMNKTPEAVKAKIASLAESNPMLGHRGCRLGIVYPEITEMQARAIFEAACNVAKKGLVVMPEVMIPLVIREEELANQADLVRKVAEEVLAEKKVKMSYLVGTMIEIPRAALTADEIARQAEFFSFGTNDLTQTGMGISRDDSAGFLGYYAEHGILERNPFETLDTVGIGRLMEIAVEGGRKTRPHIKLGICGEHGGDPASIEFCHKLGLDYVSCSPYRVPIARLAAAIAELKFPTSRKPGPKPGVVATKAKSAPKAAAASKAKASARKDKAEAKAAVKELKSATAKPKAAKAVKAAKPAKPTKAVATKAPKAAAKPVKKAAAPKKAAVKAPKVSPKKTKSTK
jgi:pyruvate,orthophosphate dikinase